MKTSLTADKARLFASLHRPGEPLILFNVWDAGSTKAVAAAGAKAIATGSASVAAAQGCADGEALPIEVALGNAERIVRSVELPVTVDFEGGYAVDAGPLAENMRRLATTGAIGCNFEDQVIGGDGLHPAEVQTARIQAARKAVGPDFFLNARTDLFLKVKDDGHDERLATAVVERAKAYAEAGASGLFVPGLADLALLERVCEGSPLPVNFMAFPGAPSTAEVAATGVARVSHGPFPFRQVMKALTEAAKAAFQA